MLGSRGQPLFPADDMSDFHLVVVHHRGQMISGKAIRLENDLVIHLGAVKAHMAAHQVVKVDGFASRHFHAKDVRLAGIGALLRLDHVVVAITSVITAVLSPFERPVLQGRGKAAVGKPGGQQLIGVFTIDR